MSDRINEFQALLYNASRLLGKLTQEPIVKNSSSSDDPLDLEDLAELSDAVSKIVDPIFKTIAGYGDLDSNVPGLFDDLCASHINDWIGSELRGKAEKLREQEPSDPGYDRADDRWKMRREPAI